MEKIQLDFITGDVLGYEENLKEWEKEYKEWKFYKFANIHMFTSYLKYSSYFAGDDKYSKKFEDVLGNDDLKSWVESAFQENISMGSLENVNIFALKKTYGYMYSEKLLNEIKNYAISHPENDMPLNVLFQNIVDVERSLGLDFFKEVFDVYKIKENPYVLIPVLRLLRNESEMRPTFRLLDLEQVNIDWNKEVNIKGRSLTALNAMFEVSLIKGNSNFTHLDFYMEMRKALLKKTTKSDNVRDLKFFLYAANSSEEASMVSALKKFPKTVLTTDDLSEKINNKRTIQERLLSRGNWRVLNTFSDKLSLNLTDVLLGLVKKEDEGYERTSSAISKVLLTCKSEGDWLKFAEKIIYSHLDPVRTKNISVMGKLDELIQSSSSFKNKQDIINVLDNFGVKTELPDYTYDVWSAVYKKMLSSVSVDDWLKKNEKGEFLLSSLLQANIRILSPNNPYDMEKYTPFFQWSSVKCWEESGLYQKLFEVTKEESSQILNELVSYIHENNDTLLPACRKKIGASYEAACVTLVENLTQVVGVLKRLDLGVEDKENIHKLDHFVKYYKGLLIDRVSLLKNKKIIDEKINNLHVEWESLVMQMDSIQNPTIKTKVNKF